MKIPDYSPDHWLEYLRLDDQKLLTRARRDTYKSSGKGGQKKNKTENAIRLVLGHLLVSETGSRSKEENLIGAVRKLRLAIALDFLKGSELRKSLTQPPVEVLPYLNQSELRINPKNRAFPFFVGWFLDRYLFRRGDWEATIKDLGTTKSQANKFVERNRALMGALGQADEYLLVLNLIEGTSAPTKPVV
ncbi:MAG: peptide chain release factor-like protein [bacterium]|nr:peptide chain release factor-like protein [bacterium]